MLNQNKKKWNDFFSSDERPPFLHFSNDQIDQILNTFPNAKTILDIGCGEGELLHELEERMFVTTGVDVSDVAIGKASEVSRGKLLIADFEDVSSEQLGRFDIIFMKFVVAFFSDLNASIKKAAHLINANGGLIVLTPVSSDELDSRNRQNEIFVRQVDIENVLFTFFGEVDETVLHVEGPKKLSLYICRKT